MTGPILGIEGSLGALSAAVVAVDGSVLGSGAADGSRALEDGLGAIDRALAALPLAEVKGIAVSVGPGSYTGSRIAVSYAKALAQAGHLPMVTISSYDVVEPDGAPHPFLALVPARTGLVCARLSLEAGAPTFCGTYDEVAGRLRAFRLADLPCCAARPDDLEALAARGILLREFPMTATPGARVAQLALARAPVADPLAVVADYGFAPVAS